MKPCSCGGIFADSKNDMLVGLMGQMGAGKTSSMTILMEYMHRKTHVPIWANYGLTLHPDSRIENMTVAVEKTRALLGIDELWLSADSRNWKFNVKASQWINQTRKKQVIVFYTTQHIRQVEMRIRNATDILIYCEKKPEGHWLQFIDWQYRTLGRWYLITHEVMRKFYGLYDTYEVLKPLSW